MNNQQQLAPGQTLNVADVTVLDGPSGRTVRCECLACGEQWSPSLQTGGGRPRGYRLCPNGCAMPSLERDARRLERRPPRY
jgi:hypothetical protein